MIAILEKRRNSVELYNVTYKKFERILFLHTGGRLENNNRVLARCFQRTIVNHQYERY